MEISSDHWLTAAIRKPLAGGGPMPTRRFLVMHFTAGATAESSINFWRTPAANGASAHLVIDRDGTIFQCRPFNRTCGHAGRSAWKDPNTGIVYTSLNSCSIGIEMANAGDSARADGTAFRNFKLPAGSARARHKNGGPVTWWEVYPDIQVARATEAAKAIVKRYNIDDLIGHDDIAPDRKNDPGPLLDMGSLRVACGFPAPIPAMK